MPQTPTPAVRSRHSPLSVCKENILISFKLGSHHLKDIPSSVWHIHPEKNVLNVHLIYASHICLYFNQVSPQPLTLKTKTIQFCPSVSP